VAEHLTRNPEDVVEIIIEQNKLKNRNEPQRKH
jgi:hypothetical protein